MLWTPCEKCKDEKSRCSKVVQVPKKPFGFDYQLDLVTAIIVDSGAQDAGVGVGWSICAVNGEKTAGIQWLDKYKAATAPFTLTFNTCDGGVHTLPSMASTLRVMRTFSDLGTDAQLCAVSQKICEKLNGVDEEKVDERDEGLCLQPNAYPAFEEFIRAALPYAELSGGRYRSTDMREKEDAREDVIPVLENANEGAKESVNATGDEAPPILADYPDLHPDAQMTSRSQLAAAIAKMRASEGAVAAKLLQGPRRDSVWAAVSDEWSQYVEVHKTCASWAQVQAIRATCDALGVLGEPDGLRRESSSEFREMKGLTIPQIGNRLYNYLQGLPAGYDTKMVTASFICDFGHAINGPPIEDPLTLKLGDRVKVNGEGAKITETVEKGATHVSILTESSSKNESIPIEDVPKIMKLGTPDVDVEEEQKLLAPFLSLAMRYDPDFAESPRFEELPSNVQEEIEEILKNLRALGF